MAKIRHVAMMVKDAALLRDFYRDGFGFEQCYGPSASGSIMVMDGLFNLALLQVRGGASPRPLCGVLESQHDGRLFRKRAIRLDSLLDQRTDLE